MDTPICKDCEHFRQHYVLTEEGLFGVYCGHCILNSTKHRPPQKPACNQFLPSSDIRDLFPSKKYVTKRLLEYLLALECLPEIEEDKSLSK